eukprot:14897349-Heterocapsa_arctica.AAC.1
MPPLCGSAPSFGPGRRLQGRSETQGFLRGRLAAAVGHRGLRGLLRGVRWRREPHAGAPPGAAPRC